MMSDPLIRHSGSDSFQANLMQPTSAPGDGEGDGWLLIYLDVLTLLLTLFVVLMAFTDFDAPEPSPDAESFVTPAPWTVLREEVTQEPESTASTVPGVSGDAARVDPLARFEIPELSDGVEVVMEDGSLRFRIQESLLFDSGRAELSRMGSRVLDQLVGTLLQLDAPVSVEGHTDNIPIGSSRFPSNWELSSLRAIVVLRRLQLQGIASDRLRAVGYGETRPLASNDTAEGRSENRRVELVLDMDDTAPTSRAP